MELSTPEAFQNFAKLCGAEHLADCTLVVDGHRIPAHKAVLFGRSTYFCAMFTDGPGLREVQQNMFEIQLENVEIEPFRRLLHFWYTGILSQPLEACDALDVLQVADYFQADDALEAVGETLKASCSFRAALRLMTIARPRVTLAKPMFGLGISAEPAQEKNIWAELWARALACVEETLSSPNWPDEDGLAALEELIEPEVTHIALRSLRADATSAAAEAITRTLERLSNVADLMRPFDMLDCDQVRSCLEVSIAMQQLQTEHMIPIGDLCLLGSMNFECEIRRPASDPHVCVRAISVNMDTASVFKKSDIYGIHVEGEVTATYGSVVRNKDLYDCRCAVFLSLMDDCKHSIKFSINMRASPPPLAQIVVKACVARLCNLMVAPSIPSWLPFGLFATVLRRSSSVPVGRLVGAAMSWASEQSDALGRYKQLCGMLSEVPVNGSLGDALRSLQDIPQKVFSQLDAHPVEVKSTSTETSFEVKSSTTQSETLVLESVQTNTDIITTSTSSQCAMVTSMKSVGTDIDHPRLGSTGIQCNMVASTKSFGTDADPLHSASVGIQYNISASTESMRTATCTSHLDLDGIKHNSLTVVLVVVAIAIALSWR
eukprot:TRINITY_DN27481_c0_g1_i1.p1 TRINITY_DN27481_c0_g1~~TRINITY_DN27481_c0_g1_i1.p1  ORF type:complete len:604 (-),score=76.72 TRINITY_DN27481_c0_g1_i1:17-1828(-)